MSHAPPTPTPPEDAPRGEITAETLAALNPPTGWWGRRFRRIEAYLSQLSQRNTFWHKVMSWRFLPLVYHSGISLGEHKGEFYEMVMPFRRFNRNWYNAMAGAALLANAEAAGGMYVFKQLGEDYTVVCKELHYRFKRPCVGPAIYRVRHLQDMEQLRRAQLEFNLDVAIEVFQAVTRRGEKERKVGECSATFHVAPKALMRARAHRRQLRDAGEAAAGA